MGIKKLGDASWGIGFNSSALVSETRAVARSQDSNNETSQDTEKKTDATSIQNIGKTVAEIKDGISIFDGFHHGG